MPLIETAELETVGDVPLSERPRSVKSILETEFSKAISVVLRDGEVLSRHLSAEPISVLCLGGKGTFLAGEKLEEATSLSPGVLLTLDAGVFHEVRSEPGLYFLLTKFKRTDNIVR